MESDAACPAVEADPLRLRQVMLNLITNAIKFTPSGGQVEVSSSVGANELRIAVRDTGAGMAPEDIPHALEPFTQVGRDHRRHQEGTGLGLPISKTLVELHGGRFEIESALGVGTTVTIGLPLATDSEAAGAASPEAPIAARHRKRNR
jgi:signal transduction histidine kinase